MGLGQSSNKTYLSVADGKIIQRVKEGTPGAVQRVTSTNKTVYELKFSNIEGFLTGISIKENEYGKDWLFEIEDGADSYTLQMMYNSRYATTFLNALCNPVMDFNLPIRITPWAKEIDGKKKTACYLQQKNEDVKWHFTKDEPNGMPALKVVQFKGKDQYDDFDMMQFLEQYINTKIKPQLYKSSPGAKANPVQPNTNFDNPQGAGYIPEPVEDSDLPF